MLENSFSCKLSFLHIDEREMLLLSLKLFQTNQLMAEVDSHCSRVQQCVVKVREVLKDKVKERERAG